MIAGQANHDSCEPLGDILAALACRIRVLSLAQVAIGFFDGNDRVANRRIAKYLDRNLFVSTKLLARQLPIPTSALFVWNVGDRPPKFASLVATARKRWFQSDATLTQTFMLGPIAARLLGIRYRGRLSHPLQVSHDLGLAGVYVSMRRDRKELVSRWIGEDFAVREPGQIPDAVLVNPAGRISQAIEFCGLYSEVRIKRFHDHCVDRRLPYELW